MQEMSVQSLGEVDPLEKEMVTHFSMLAWEILWTEEPGRLQSMGSQKSQTRPSTAILKQMIAYFSISLLLSLIYHIVKMKMYSKNNT